MAFVNFKSNKQNKCRNQIGNVQTHNQNAKNTAIANGNIT